MTAILYAIALLCVMAAVVLTFNHPVPATNNDIFTATFLLLVFLKKDK